MEYRILKNNYIYKDIYNTTTFEEIIKDRFSAHYVKLEDNKIPIMRTTMKHKSINIFTPIIMDIIKEIGIEFNTCNVELYKKNYKKMKWHTDISLDLKNDSYICIYSCYQSELNEPSRKLVVKNKTNGDIESFILEHNSIVLFSTEFNKNHIHKIELINDRDNDWIGITMQQSKTFIGKDLYFIDEPRKKITKATNEQTLEFYKYKSLENKNIDFEYPLIDYTLNDSKMYLKLLQ
jgi:hypothetical protein